MAQGVYQHDGPAVFRFEVTGLLDGPVVEELEHAWITAASVLQGKDLVLDISELAGADDAGIRLLVRMKEAGARIIPPAWHDSPQVAHALGMQWRRSAPEPAKRPLAGLLFWLFRRRKLPFA